MVQYILTPWRSRHELVLVRDQFYPQYCGGRDHDKDQRAGSDGSHHHQQQQQQQQQLLLLQQNEDDSVRLAVARVSMWMQRGSCPHMVESTALFVACVVIDGEQRTRVGTDLAVRAAYSAAFSRFVTGLLDGHQDKLRKQSMYSIAELIGLPATFVELRHQATHEQLPSLAKLRSATCKALDWIWDYYWKHLTWDDEAARPADPCREAVMQYLRGGDDEKQMAQTLKSLARFDKETVLRAIKKVQGDVPGNLVYLRCMRLSSEVMTRQQESPGEKQAEAEPEQMDAPVPEDEAVAQHDERDRQMADAVSGWSLYKGPWTPKPIGVV